MVKDPEKELEQLKYGLLYLADVWESFPLSVEDPELCRRHAVALRSLIHFHIRFLEADATDGQIEAAVHRARLAGFSPNLKITQEDIDQMRRALRQAEMTDLFQEIEDFLRSTSTHQKPDAPEEDG
jgi:hypothetical protein